MNWAEYSERFGETKAEHLLPEPTGDECKGGECRYDKEVGAIDPCDRHAEADEIENAKQESGEGHYLGCVCIDCNHRSGDRIADNE